MEVFTERHLERRPWPFAGNAPPSFSFPPWTALSLNKSRRKMPEETLQPTVLRPGATPYDAGLLAELLNLEVSAFDMPHGPTRQQQRSHHHDFAPGSPSGAPGAPSGSRSAPGGVPLSPSGRRYHSPSGRAGSPGGSPSAMIPVGPFHPPPSIVPPQIPEGYRTLTTQCDADVREQQICSPEDAFCFEPNFHCCGQDSQPEFCPGKVTTPVIPGRSVLASACLREQAACLSGDHESCARSTPLCAAFHTSLRT